LKRIQDSMNKVGFLENYPVTVAPLGDGTYLLIDGNHRYESACALELASVPCLVKHGLPEDEMYRLAIQSNNASVTSVPMTMVAYAEFIWARLEEKTEDDKKRYTQGDAANMLGWSKDSVQDYASLRKIDSQAWGIVTANFENGADGEENGVATSKTATAVFSENLLRSILSLTTEQQLELVKERANDPKTFTPGKFKSRAQAYNTRNQMKAYALPILGELGEPYTTKLTDEIYSGAYDNDWFEKDKDGNLKVKETHPKLDGLIQSIRDEWEKKNSTRLIHGDFYEEVLKIGDGSIDLIVTDPPYNVASDREFTGISAHAGIQQARAPISRQQAAADAGLKATTASKIVKKELAEEKQRAELEASTAITEPPTEPEPEIVQPPAIEPKVEPEPPRLAIEPLDDAPIAEEPEPISEPVAPIVEPEVVSAVL